MNYRFLNLLILAIFMGCNSSDPTFKRISDTFTKFAIQLGRVTKASGGDNGGFDFCLNLHIDKYENVYCSGYTQGSMADTLSGSQDAVVVKLDPNGKLLWVRQLGVAAQITGGDNSGAESCTGISTDGDGNVYCFGYTTGDVGATGRGSADYDVFLAKFSPAGNLAWIKQWGTFADDLGSEVIIANDGYLYVAGTTRGGFLVPTTGEREMFITRVDLNGNRLKTFQTGVAGQDLVCGRIRYDNNGSFICPGYYRIPGPIVAPASDREIHLVKVDLNLEEVWTRTISTPGDEYVSDVAFDSAGNLFVFGAGSGDFVAGEGNGSSDLILLKLNSSGNEIWRRQLGKITVGAAQTAATEAAIGVAIGRNDGKIYVGAYSTGDFAEVNAGVAVGTPHRDVVLVRLSPINGDPELIRHFGEDTRVVPGGSNAASDTLLAFTQDPLGYFIFAGYTNGAMIEQNGDLLNTFSLGDFFIFRTDSNGNR